MRTALKAGVGFSTKVRNAHASDVPINVMTPAEYLAEMAKQQKRNKYGNKFTLVDGIQFASKREANRWRYLKSRTDIHRLKRQTRFQLTVEGFPICVYVADFEYYEGAARVVEDSKGVESAVFKLKWKLCKAIYPDIFWRIV